MRAVFVDRRQKNRDLGKVVFPDDPVSVAASRLESLLKDRVYMWCRRSIDAHEAMAIAIAGTVHVTGTPLYEPEAVRAQLAERMGVALSGDILTPAKCLRKLSKLEVIGEGVPMRNRYVIPGGYYSSMSACPYDEPPDSLNLATSRPQNYGHILLENFQPVSDTIFVTTESELVAAKPEGVGAGQWKRNFVSAYIPDTPDHRVTRWSPEIDAFRHRQVGMKSKAGGGKTAVTYIPMSGGMVPGTGRGVGLSQLHSFFSSNRATKSIPIIQIAAPDTGRPVSRVHDSVDEATLSSLRNPPGGSWLRVGFALEKGMGVLTIYPNGSYKCFVRFKVVDQARLDNVTPYIDAFNGTLAKIDPMIRPMSRLLTPSYSVFIQKPYLLQTPAVIPGVLNFTGKHRCAVEGPGVPDIGSIVCSTGRYCDLDGNDRPKIDEAIPVVDVCSKRDDPTVFGVVSAVESVGEKTSFCLGPLRFPRRYGSRQARVVVNSCGEGGILVCDSAGPLKNGDLLCSSHVRGRACRQSDDVVRATTVAKVTCDCDFGGDEMIGGYRERMVGCVYKF